MESSTAFKARKAIAMIDCAQAVVKAAAKSYCAMKDIPIIGHELGRIAALASIEAGKVQMMNIRSMKEPTA